MKLLRRFDQPIAAAHCANVLRAAGIRCTVKNTLLGSGVGDIPFLECQPEVWIDHDIEEAHARTLLAEIEHIDVTVAVATWTCRCGEPIEPQFGACWRCGTSRSVMC